MTHADICDAIRTPFGRYGGSLSSVRTDDLGAIPLKALMARNPKVDWDQLADVLYGCANQAGEAQLMIAGGVESMSRAPFVMPQAETAFSRSNAIYDTTIGWRFVNRRMKELYGVDAMPETAENVATDFQIERAAQDRMVLASQLKAVAAQQAGHLALEITPVTIPAKKGEPTSVSQDEHPRETSLEALAKLKGVVRPDGTVTAGNASGVNEGSCALLLASEAAAARQGLTPRARLVGMATAGVAPRIMGVGPARRRRCARCWTSPA